MNDYDRIDATIAEMLRLRARVVELEEQLNLLVTDRYALRARVAELEAKLAKAHSDNAYLASEWSRERDALVKAAMMTAEGLVSGRP